MRRRRFLQAVVAALLTPRARAQQGRTPHVVIVGAGPAGLSAGLELVQRGVLVTVVEATAQVGGQAKGWSEPLGDAVVDVDSGVQLVPSRARHLHELLRRYALDDALSLVPGEAFVHRASGRTWPYMPTALARTLASAGERREARLVRRAARWLRDATAGTLRAAHAGHPASGIERLTPYRFAGEALTRARFWTAPDALDAAAALEDERLAYGGWLTFRGNPQALVWEPLATALRSQRGRLRLSHRVDALRVEAGRVTGVVVGEPERSFVVGAPAGSSWVTAGDGAQAVHVRRDGDGWLGLSARCTHAGCAVAPEASGGLRCPCHGGRYDAHGAPIAGPPPAPLDRATVDEVDGALQVRLGGTLEPVEADAVILAAGGATHARLLAALGLGADMAETRPHAVARFWFPVPVAADTPAVQTVEDGRWITSIALVHRLQGASRAWADGAAGAVVEVTAGRPLPPAMTSEAILDLLEEELRLLLPALQAAAPLKRALSQGQSATWLRPGWMDRAATTRGPLPGLYAAGDHVAADCEGVLLERAVATGRLAASAVLEDLGLPRLEPLHG